MTYDDYRALLAFSRRHNNHTTYSNLDACNKKQYRRNSLLRKHAAKANLQVAKVANQNVYTLIAPDGLAVTFDNLDAAFDFAHKYHIVKDLILEE